MTTTQMPRDTERARQLAALRAKLLEEAMRAAAEPRKPRVRLADLKIWEFFRMPHA